MLGYLHQKALGEAEFDQYIKTVLSVVENTNPFRFWLVRLLLCNNNLEREFFYKKRVYIQTT